MTLTQAFIAFAAALLLGFIVGIPLRCYQEGYRVKSVVFAYIGFAVYAFGGLIIPLVFIKALREIEVELNHKITIFEKAYYLVRLIPVITFNYYRKFPQQIWLVTGKMDEYNKIKKIKKRKLVVQAEMKPPFVLSEMLTPILKSSNVMEKMKRLGVH